VAVEHEGLLKARPERRDYRRVKLVTQVRCAGQDRAEIMVTRDVSLGGVFINADLPIAVDSELTLTFRLFPEEPAITCRAKVIYSRLGMGMGIQFQDLSRAARQSLQKFVDEVS